MLKINTLSAFYGKAQVIFDLNAEIKRGKFTAIIGKNGSGKSSLLSCIGGMKSYRGKIFLNESDLSALSGRERAKHISFLPQNLPITQFSVWETVAFGREPHTSFKLSSGDVEIIEASIEKCGISHLKDKKLTEISGGERQMAYLAMTLAQDSELMLLDEPTTYMDAPRTRRFLEILKEAQAGGKSIVAVMHDLTAAVKYADDIIIIEDGRAAFCGAREDCLKNHSIETLMGVESHRLEDETVVFI